jgi:hypothetical protein
VELISSNEGEDGNEPLDGGVKNDHHDGMPNMSRGYFSILFRF